MNVEELTTAVTESVKPLDWFENSSGSYTAWHGWDAFNILTMAAIGDDGAECVLYTYDGWNYRSLEAAQAAVHEERVKQVLFLLELEKLLDRLGI